MIDFTKKESSVLVIIQSLIGFFLLFVANDLLAEEKFLSHCRASHPSTEDLITLQALSSVVGLPWRGASTCQELNRRLKMERALDLRGQSLKDIHPVFWFPNIRQLAAGRNRLLNIEGISALHQLEYLDLGENKLVDFSEVSRLKGLRELRLAENPGATLPNFADMPELRTLSLSGMKLDTLQSIRALRKLDYLSISRNSLSDVSILENMPTLKNLNVTQNRLCDTETLRRLSLRVKIIGSDTQRCEPSS